MPEHCKDCGKPIPGGQKLKLCAKCGTARLFNLLDSSDRLAGKEIHKARKKEKRTK
jgi:hypothetical protein